jgi:uncharacterized protein (TIGR00369 family)
MSRERWEAEYRAVRERSAVKGSGVCGLDVLKSMSGLDFLRAILEARLPYPPICETLDFSFVRIDRGEIDLIGEPRHGFYNPIGTVHGGWAATLLDSCMGCAVHSMLAAGQGYTTVEIKVNYARPISTATGPMRGEGRCLTFGARVATAEGKLLGHDGKLYAHGTTTCLVFPL